MDYGLRHEKAGKPPRHEVKPYVRRSHGYSVQSSVLQSSGAPEEVPGHGDKRQPMTRFDSEGDSGDIGLPSNNLNDLGVNGGQPAGYDLQGVEGAENGTTPIQGRATREAVPLNTHPGYEQQGSDYGQPDESLTRDQRFRYRQSFDGV